MLGGQHLVIDCDIDFEMNPQRPAQNIEMCPQEIEKEEVQQLFKTFGQIDQQSQSLSQIQNSNGCEMFNEVSNIQMDQQESRPSPLEQSNQQSNNSKSKSKPPPLSNELIRLTKKATASSKREKKVRYYVTDFQPYLPSFLDEMHKQHHKNIVRIGEKYQVSVDPHPKYKSMIRPMSHLRVWKGSEEQVDQNVFKKFREVFGQHRTEEDLILFKSRLQTDNWSDLMKQLNEQKQSGKKPSLQIANNNINGTMTRNK